MPWLNVVLLFYALLDLVMGVLGYVNKHSLISLIAGTTAAILILFSMAYAKVHPRAGRIIALVVAVLMLGNFARNTFLKNEHYPSGIMFVSSLIVVICLGAGHMMGMKARRAQLAEEAKLTKKGH